MSSLVSFLQRLYKKGKKYNNVILKIVIKKMKVLKQCTDDIIDNVKMKWREFADNQKNSHKNTRNYLCEQFAKTSKQLIAHIMNYKVIIKCRMGVVHFINKVQLMSVYRNIRTVCSTGLVMLVSILLLVVLTETGNLESAFAAGDEFSKVSSAIIINNHNIRYDSCIVVDEEELRKLQMASEGKPYEVTLPNENKEKCIIKEIDKEDSLSIMPEDEDADEVISVSTLQNESGNVNDDVSSESCGEISSDVVNDENHNIEQNVEETVQSVEETTQIVEETTQIVEGTTQNVEEISQSVEETTQKDAIVEEKTVVESKNTVQETKKTVEENTICGIDKDEFDLLCRIIEAEAEGEDIKGKILVANVVLNRVKDDEFPDTISEVILQKENGRAQFSPVSNGRLWRVKISKDGKEAARRALEGEDYSSGALYFMARKYSDKKNVEWFDNNLKRLFKHGCHEFFK